jgi:hypothetical protein
MSTHIFGLTVATLADASRAARTVDHAVTLVDEVSHVVVIVDQRGRVTMRPQSATHSVDRPPSPRGSYIQA